MQDFPTDFHKITTRICKKKIMSITNLLKLRLIGPKEETINYFKKKKNGQTEGQVHEITAILLNGERRGGTN